MRTPSVMRTLLFGMQSNRKHTPPVGFSPPQLKTWQPFWVRGWPHRARRAPPTAWCDGTSRVGSCGPSRSCARWMRNARVQGGSLTPAYTRSHACVGTEDLSKARTHPTPENCRPVRKALAALLGIHGGPWWQRLLPLRGGQAWAPRIVGFTTRTSLG